MGFILSSLKYFSARQISFLHHCQTAVQFLKGLNGSLEKPISPLIVEDALDDWTSRLCVLTSVPEGVG